MSHLEYLNKVAHLGRLNRHQMMQIATELNTRITRMLGRVNVYLYVVVTIRLDEEGRPIPGEHTVQSMRYEGKSEDQVYFSGQKEFQTMTTTDQVMVDTVIRLE